MSTKQIISTATWSPSSSSSKVDALLNRPAFEPQAEAAARSVLDAIQKEGDKAVLRFAKKFDGSSLTAASMRVTPEEIAAAAKQVDPAFKRAARDTKKRIRAFAANGMRKNWTMKTPRGGKLGEVYTPLDRIGAYIPGGEAPLVSTALMTIAFAQKAGVKEIVACSPAGKDGAIDPYTPMSGTRTTGVPASRYGTMPAIHLRNHCVRRTDPSNLRGLCRHGSRRSRCASQSTGQTALE